MKKCILLVVLFLVVGIATFGQTAFIDRGGKVELVPVEVKVDTLIIIPEDLSEIENLPGTLDQKLWALQNPGRDTLVEKKDTIVYSKFGLTVYCYDIETWIISDDGKKLDFYSHITLKGKRPAWESYIVSVIVLLISYIVGRYQKLYKNKLSFFSLKELFGVVFILMFLFACILNTGKLLPISSFFLFCLFVVLIIGFLFIDYWKIEMLLLLIITCVLGFGYGSFIGALQIVLVLCGLSAAGYLIAYNTTKKKTEPEHTN
jgi:hypothetical protein